MSRSHSHLNTAVKLIALYNGGQPFAAFIKNYFSNEKKYGSKDRRQISSLCYNYFRVGFAMKNSTAAQKIITANFLCETEPTEFLQKVNDELNNNIQLPLDDKLLMVKDQFFIEEIFPFGLYLSESVNAGVYCRAMLVQPNLFLRIRPQCRLTALKKLEKIKLNYQLLKDNCIELPATTNAEDFFIVDKEVVIQDYNSQQVLNYLCLNEATLFVEDKRQRALSVWDCCAASGGKSILVYDILKHKIDLTISDIRLAIVLNLHKRFKTAKIKEYKYIIADIADKQFVPPATGYQLIICDAPCTGSGTWGRTPEQLCFFNADLIKEFSSKQKRIVSNVVPHLRQDGIFVYITCSVFKEENEAISNFIEDTFSLKLLHHEVLQGFDKKADTMFVSIFKK